MSDSYEDILHLPRPVSQRHARMSLLDRAAQFSPFAALTGYEAAIGETARLTQQRIFLDVDAQAELNGKLVQLQKRFPETPEVTLTYFIPDAQKAGGSYRRVTARVRRIDAVHQWLQLDTGEQVLFADILEIQ